MDIKEYEELFGKYKPEYEEQLISCDDIILYATREECELLCKEERRIALEERMKMKRKNQFYKTERISPYATVTIPIYAKKSNMTKREAEFLFVHRGNMSEWRLEMLLENGYELEANDEWNKFIEDLLNQREITMRQYNNWKDRFIKYLL